MTESDNEKGNKYHDEEGKFTSPDGVGEASKEDDSLGTIALSKTPSGVRIAKSDSIFAFLASKREKKDQEAKEFLESNTGYMTPSMTEYFSSLSVQDKRDLLAKSDNEYSKLFLRAASDKEIEALMCAEILQHTETQAFQDVELAKKKLEIARKKGHEKLDEFAKEHPIDLSGIWFAKTPTLADYGKLSKPAYEGLSSLDAKRAYYNGLIESDMPSEDAKQGYMQKLEALKAFEEYGKQYEELATQIALENEGEVTALESELNDLQQRKNSLETYGLAKKANEFISKFQDPSAMYSYARKNKALWITQEWAKQHGYSNAQDAAYHYLGEKFEKMWNSMTPSERNQLSDYTGNGFSKYNKPLRGLSHSGWKGFGFAKGVTEITNAIDKCVWDEDMWIQRGIADSKMFRLPGSDSLHTIGEMSDGQFQSLVGMTFVDNGFMSCGAGKNTGFINQIIFNFYCPKGTKGAYMNTKGHYTHSNENEMILQRGYEYRITKVQKGNGRTYIDCDVILGSDKNKVTDMNQLDAIGKKYLN